MWDHLFNKEKLKYIKGPKADVECVLCAIRDGVPELKSLVVHRNASFIVSVNLFPFNRGHMMIFPLRHLTGLAELTEEEALELHRLMTRTIGILQDEFNPAGFNVGYNLGRSSGASIQHVHAHIVPRYDNEVGFLDVMAGSRVIVGDPVEARDLLKERFASLSF